MKKLISLFVAVLMVVSMFTISASAVDTPSPKSETIGGVSAEKPDGKSTQPVYIVVTGTPNDRYAIDIDFQALEFTYSTGATWNPTTHQYDVGTTGTWSAARTITIKNHSNQAITYLAEFDKTNTSLDDAMSPISISLSKDTADIRGCTVSDPVGTPPNDTINVTVSGKPNKGEVAATIIGTVTVTISKAAG